MIQPVKNNIKKLATSFHASLCRVIQYRFIITVATGWSQLEVTENKVP